VVDEETALNTSDGDEGQLAGGYKRKSDVVQ